MRLRALWILLIVLCVCSCVLLGFLASAHRRLTGCDQELFDQRSYSLNKSQSLEALLRDERARSANLLAKGKRLEKVVAWLEKNQVSQELRALQKTFSKEAVLRQHLEHETLEVKGSPHLDEKVKDAKIRELKLKRDYIDELKNQTLLLGKKLSHVLQNDTAFDLKRLSQERLLELQKAAILQKQKFEAIAHSDDGDDEATIVSKKDILEQLMDSVANSASRFEEGLKDEVFEASKQSEGASFDTVVRLEGKKNADIAELAAEKMVPSAMHEYPAGFDITSSKSASEPASIGRFAGRTLVDSQNNYYKLSRAADSWLVYTDESLVRDALVLWLVSCLAGSLMMTVNLPSFYGYILAGIICNPSALDLIENLVQIQSVSDLGVYFMLFVLGMKFSVHRLAKVWRVSLLGGFSMISITVVVGYYIGLFWEVPVGGAVIGLCVSLSSAAVVLRCLDSLDHGSYYHETVVGICLFQDVVLGLILPLMDSASGPSSLLFTKLIELLSRFALLVIICAGLARVLHMFIGRMLGSYDKAILTNVAICLLMSQMSEHIGLSLELGAFFGGLVVSYSDQYTKAVIEVMDPLKEALSALFFASVGLHIYPSFFFEQWHIMLLCASSCVFFKYALGIVVMFLCCHMDIGNASLISIGISQISEFSFVLASNARTNGVISRQVYYLILCSTALTFPVTPVLWRLSKRWLPPVVRQNYRPQSN